MPKFTFSYERSSEPEHQISGIKCDVATCEATSCTGFKNEQKVVEFLKGCLMVPGTYRVKIHREGDTTVGEWTMTKSVGGKVVCLRTR